MKKYAIATITAAMLSAPAITAKADPLYISLSGGLNLMSNSDAKVSDTETSIKNAVEYKRGYALEGAFGEKTGVFRGEIAVGYQSSDVDKVLGSDIVEQLGEIDNYEDLTVTASALTVMYNVYADYDMKGILSPYLMGGLGAAFVDMGTSFKVDGVEYDSSYDKTVFAWQLGAGLGIKITNNVALDLGYRYFKTGDLDLGNNTKLSFGGSKILLGMRYNL